MNAKVYNATLSTYTNECNSYTDIASRTVGGVALFFPHIHKVGWQSLDLKKQNQF